jgi:hypothetical protein
LYFPYVRGRRFECLAIRALVQKMAREENVTPIIEPVTSDPGDVKRVCETLSDASVPHIVIHNPVVGALKDSYRDQAAFVRAALEEDETVIHGLLIQPATELAEVTRFMRAYGGERTAIIHWTDYEDMVGLQRELRAAQHLRYNVLISPNTSAAYRRRWPRRVWVADGFQVQARNADYPDDELFSEIYLTYEQEGNVGFGDFLTVGRRFLLGGGPAHAVVIHLTYEHQARRAIWARHFVSDTTRVPPYETGPKFLQALRKLVRVIDGRRDQFAFSEACDEFRALHGRGHSPGLGKVKELSMRHHIELMMHVS